MYSEGLHILFVELDKKIKLYLENSDPRRNFSQFEIELLNEISWILSEILEQAEIENSEHDGNTLNAKILEKYGYYT